MSVGVLAIFSGLLGAYGLRAVLLSEPPARAVPNPTIIVPLATADLPAGRVVRFGDVGIHRMTQKQLIERKLANPNVMLSPEQVMGRRLREPVKQGEPFLLSSMYLEGDPNNVSELLKPGFRAVSIQVPELLGGVVEAGATVDVLFRSSAGKSPNGRVFIPETTVTLIEAVEVLAVERQKPIVQRSNSLDLRTRGRPVVFAPPPTVTLAVSLEQANVLRTVDGRGTISLVPRPTSETVSPAPGVVSVTKQFTLESLLSLQPPKAPFATEIYRRSSRSVRVFGDDELERALSLVTPPTAPDASAAPSDTAPAGSAPSP